MDENEWLNATNPMPMLEFLRCLSDTSQRKWRLFAAACCRRILCLTGDERVHQVAEVVEWLAEGLPQKKERRIARNTALLAAQESTVGSKSNVAWAIYCATAKNAARAAQDCSLYALQTVGGPSGKAIWPGVTNGSAARAAERTVQCGLLRDIVASPFTTPRPIDAAWLLWNDSTVRRIAEGIYEERAFERMGVLADALLDAGCNDEVMLAHCRQQGAVHARGCFVLDLLLGKE